MNTQNTIRIGIYEIVACSLVLLSVGRVAHADDHLRTYRVTVQNLTEGQALTPPLVATHAYGTHVFKVGEPASAELQAIAENGNNMLLHDIRTEVRNLRI